MNQINLLQKQFEIQKEINEKEQAILKNKVLEQRATTSTSPETTTTNKTSTSPEIITRIVDDFKSTTIREIPTFNIRLNIKY